MIALPAPHVVANHAASVWLAAAKSSAAPAASVSRNAGLDPTWSRLRPTPTATTPAPRTPTEYAADRDAVLQPVSRPIGAISTPIEYDAVPYAPIVARLRRIATCQSWNAAITRLIGSVR
ncbi:MAG: hypothetical protein WCI61_07330 [Chloroflexota bacterium]